MKSVGYIMFLTLLLGCSSSKKHLSLINKYNYRFLESGDRNIFITILTDSTLQVSNRTNIAHHYWYMNFNTIYRYKKLNVSHFVIEQQLKTDKQPHKNLYYKPFENKQYPGDTSAIKYVFPNITSDTIRLSADLKKLQIREFLFEAFTKRDKK